MSAAACGVGVAVPLSASALEVLGGNAFGSYWRVVVAKSAMTASISPRVSEIVASVDSSMSPYRAETEISRLNNADTRDWMELSASMNAVLGSALETSRRTDGAFDPTVGALVGRYGFGPIRGDRFGTASDLVLRDGALRKGHGKMNLDLCGIAKGWALDLIVAELTALGLSDFLVELGGEVAVRGHHPEGRAWRVAVDGPSGPSPQLALQIEGKAIATSGNMLQGYQIGSGRVGHIINPQSGVAPVGDLASVSVVSETAMEADALATSLFALGREAGGAMAASLGLDVLMQFRDGAEMGLESFGAIDAWLV